MKKILIASSLVLFSGEAFSAGDVSSNFAGGQIGLKLGLGSFSASHKELFYHNDGAGSEYESTNDRKTSEIAVNAGAFAKYTIQRGKLLAGVEAHGYWHNVNQKIDNNEDRDTNTGVVSNYTQTRKIKSNYGFGLGVNIGTDFNGAHLYAKLGGVMSKFKVNGSFIEEVKSKFNDPVGLNEFDTINKTRFGFAPGLGMEAAINDRLRLNLEVVYEMYSKINGDQASRKAKKTDGTDATDTYELKNRKITPRNVRATIGIGFRLGK